jgi:hypothetical protein
MNESGGYEKSGLLVDRMGHDPWLAHSWRHAGQGRGL